MAKIEIEVPDGSIPEGFEPTGEFRYPKKGEYFCTMAGDGKALQATFNYDLSSYLILRRIPQLKQVIFTVAGAPRPIKAGEWFIASDNESILYNKYGIFNRPRVPLTREEVWE